LGVVLYEMLTGRVPFEAEGALATAMKHVTEDPIPPRERDPYVPEALGALVMGLLAKDPEDRCPSAAELSEDLRRALEGSPPASVAGTVGHPEAPRAPAGADAIARPREPGNGARRRRLVAIGLVALLALLALLGAFGSGLTGGREGSKAVGTVNTAGGARELGAPVAPEDLRGARDGGAGKGGGSGGRSANLAGGAAHVPASTASASASPASATASASPQGSASEPSASGPRQAAPSASSPQSGGASGSGGQDAGRTMGTGTVESPAQRQYR
jgi:hypothetical protein